MRTETTTRTLYKFDELSPEAQQHALEEEMRPLREAAFNDSTSFSSKIVEAYSQVALNQQARMSVYKRKHSL